MATVDGKFGPRSVQVNEYLLRLQRLSQEQWVALGVSFSDVFSVPRMMAATKVAGAVKLEGTREQAIDKESRRCLEQVGLPRAWFPSRHSYYDASSYAKASPTWIAQADQLPGWVRETLFLPLDAAGVEYRDLLPPLPVPDEPLPAEFEGDDGMSPQGRASLR